ncbi:hypothetical protein EYF80_051766 [Liparis tanakae]|uniref:Uncharacterized protein n=1 Tax=Liparis tanakae TaxID=230148 RepID=A0A4Z2FA86_9TELE|nr:hypothetical protein EYF80_051766 [Liparis tanakae]
MCPDGQERRRKERLWRESAEGRAAAAAAAAALLALALKRSFLSQEQNGPDWFGRSVKVVFQNPLTQKPPQCSQSCE